MRSLLSLAAAALLLSLLAPLAQAAPADAACAFQMHWSLIAGLDEHPWIGDPPRQGANQPQLRGSGADPWAEDPPRNGANKPDFRGVPIGFDDYPWQEDPPRQGANKPQP